MFQRLRSAFSRNLLLTAITLVAAIGAAVVSIPSHAQSLSDYGENNTIDVVFRGQTWTLPSNLYVGLSTSACSDSSTGTEVSGGSYARVAVARSLAAWAGTQSAGSTAASTGTGGQTSNNAVVSFPTPTESWGTVSHMFIITAITGGNVIVCKALAVPKTINIGDTVTFPAGSVTVSFD